MHSLARGEKTTVWERHQRNTSETVGRDSCPSRLTCGFWPATSSSSLTPCFLLSTLFWLIGCCNHDCFLTLKNTGQPLRKEQSFGSLSCIFEHNHADRCILSVDKPLHLLLSLPLPTERLWRGGQKRMSSQAVVSERWSFIDCQFWNGTHITQWVVAAHKAFVLKSRLQVRTGN